MSMTHDLVSSIWRMSSLQCATHRYSIFKQQWQAKLDSLWLFPLCCWRLSSPDTADICWQIQHIETKPNLSDSYRFIVFHRFLLILTCRGGWPWCRSLGSEPMLRLNRSTRATTAATTTKDDKSYYGDFRIHEISEWCWIIWHYRWKTQESWPRFSTCS